MLWAFFSPRMRDCGQTCRAAMSFHVWQLQEELNSLCPLAIPHSPEIIQNNLLRNFVLPQSILSFQPTASSEGARQFSGLPWLAAKWNNWLRSITSGCQRQNKDIPPIISYPLSLTVTDWLAGMTTRLLAVFSPFSFSAGKIVSGLMCVWLQVFSTTQRGTQAMKF